MGWSRHSPSSNTPCFWIFNWTWFPARWWRDYHASHLQTVRILSKSPPLHDFLVIAGTITILPPFKRFIFWIFMLMWYFVYLQRNHHAQLSNRPHISEIFTSKWEHDHHVCPSNHPHMFEIFTSIWFTVR